jgi:hypothetical protein
MDSHKGCPYENLYHPLVRGIFTLDHCLYLVRYLDAMDDKVINSD